MPRAAPGLDSAAKLLGFETFRERGEKKVFPNRRRTGDTRELPGFFSPLSSYCSQSVIRVDGSLLYTARHHKDLRLLLTAR